MNPFWSHQIQNDFGLTDMSKREMEPGLPTLVLMTALSLTVMFSLVAGTFMLIQRRRKRLNWYDNNLLEIARSISPPNHVKCRGIRRLHTEEERFDQPGNRYNPRKERIRKQSRIQEINRHSVECGSVQNGDFSTVFTIPKMDKSRSSMFRSLDTCKIDRDLYMKESKDGTIDRMGNNESSQQSLQSAGSLKIALNFDSNLNLLTIGLREALDLVAKRQDGFPNPYFKVSLIDPTSSFPKIEHRSRVYKNTSSPMVSEEFFFHVHNGNINQCHLEINIFDYDQFSVDECFGYSWINLRRMSVSTARMQPTVLWAEVLSFDERNGKGFGEILFSLTYLAKAQRLTVNVFKARNLKTIESNDVFSSISVRISLSRVNEKRRFKRKKTSSKKNTQNLQFNESLVFNVQKNTLFSTLIEFEIVHEHGTLGMASNVLGRLAFPLHRYLELWPSIARDEKAQSQARWYSLEDPNSVW